MAIAKSFFYHAHTRRLMSAFGSLFSNMSVARFDNNGNVVEVIKKIPIENELNDKAMTRHNAQQQDGGPLATRGHVTYPRMSYALTDVRPNPERKLARMQRIVRRNGDDVAVTPVQTPFDWEFELKIMAKNMTDALELYEQIVWAFCPTVTITIRDTPFDTEHADVPISLTQTRIEDNANNLPEESVRLVIIHLTFTAQYWMYGPAASDKEFAVARLLGMDVDAIKPRVEKLVIDVVTDETEFYSGNTSGVRYTVSDANGDGVPDKLLIEIPPEPDSV